MAKSKGHASTKTPTTADQLAPSTATPTAHGAFVAIGVEAGFVFVMVMIAGTGRTGAGIAIATMLLLLLVQLVQHTNPVVQFVDNHPLIPGYAPPVNAS